MSRRGFPALPGPVRVPPAILPHPVVLPRPGPVLGAAHRHILPPRGHTGGRLPPPPGFTSRRPPVLLPPSPSHGHVSTPSPPHPTPRRSGKSRRPQSGRGRAGSRCVPPPKKKLPLLGPRAVSNPRTPDHRWGSFSPAVTPLWGVGGRCFSLFLYFCIMFSSSSGKYSHPAWVKPRGVNSRG